MPSMGIAVDDVVELRPLGEPNTSHFSVTMQCLGVDVTSLILASGFVPLSQAFCYCAFSPNCLPPEIHVFFIKLLYRVHINLPYCIALHLRTLENLNQM